MQELVKKHAEKLRFGIVGVANTAIDFAILFILVELGVDKIVANFFSTGVAFIFSFFVNKSFTFKTKGGNVKKQFGLFIVVTMIGLWIIQPAIIYVIDGLLASTGWGPSLILLIAKLLASVASLIWNYLFYSRIVFKKPKEQEEK
ncbi:MAG: sugar translocase [Candidatus Saccharibacteria bacterium]|nr:sugar translocase [Candidatus Saccharibacteria bacterium]